MSWIKTPVEIEKLRRGGALLAQTLREIRQACVAGSSTAELDALARDRFQTLGATPSFLGYRIKGQGPGFPGALCTSINAEVVHAPPVPGRILREGDVVGLDLGMWYEGLATDMATTVIIGSGNERIRALVADTRSSLVAGLQAVRAGHCVQDISGAIEDALQPRKYGIIRDLVGHGVGHAVHEDPAIPNYRDPSARPVRLKAGMVLAIEPMVSLGGWQVCTQSDGWTIVTADGSVAAHFEVTVAVTKTGYDLLTPWPDVD